MHATSEAESVPSRTPATRVRLQCVGTAMQQQVPPDMLARVSSLSLFPSYGVGVIGYAIDGPLAAAVRPSAVFAVGAAYGLLSSAAVLTLQLRHADDPVVRRQLTWLRNGAVVGIVPCKVSAENGPIKVGDLLVTSSTPGYGMKGTNRSKMLGAVVGKALEPMREGKGVVQVLVTLQ